MIRTALRAALGLSAALLATAAARDPFAGRVAGAPSQCIDPSNLVDGPRIIDARTIIYQQGRRLWRTGPIGPCQRLGPNVTLIVEQFSSSQLCRNDRFRVREMGDVIPSAPCRFTAFTPYDRPR